MEKKLNGWCKHSENPQLCNNCKDEQIAELQAKVERLKKYKKLAKDFYSYHKMRSIWNGPSLGFKVRYELLAEDK